MPWHNTDRDVFAKEQMPSITYELNLNMQISINVNYQRVEQISIKWLLELNS
jgi:hypothetical protein